MTIGTLIIFVGVLAMMLILVFAFQGTGRDRQRRLEAVTQRAHGARSSVAVQATVKRQETKGTIPGLDELIKRILPRQSALRDRLDRTGKSISVGGYVAVSLILVVVVFAVARLVFGFSTGMALPMAVAMGVGIPHWIVGKMAAKRLSKFNSLFPDAIDLIVRGLKSGLPVTESIGAVGREMADPVGCEFIAVFDAMKFGKTLEESLWEAAGRLDTPEFKFFVISLSVQKETGGNLAETLANLSDILRKRRQMRLKIKAMSSEAKASAMILGSLPFIMFGIISAMNWEYERALFTDPRGIMMLGVGLGMMGSGIAVMAKMVRFEI
ncbi:type II secretion system F family protein [Magnetospira sp. QH-2]|uniref:type II secretion system F family protein n=1 Tax=Magnetospira sp. (strain QH-2) TaxID=1288970 RepID=UPI0003E80D5D|nr:type II secretion system F family protein [Magnetospira sp. QH-2]CCQ73554.1 Conserved membrane protein of unknown function [Magnetospira sp. QH-2]